MKVVHLSTTDYGGAYKAAERISQSLKMYGVDSVVIVRSKSNENSYSTELFYNKRQYFVSKVKNVLNLLLSKGEIISDYFGTDITKYEVIKQADIIVLHWVNSFISYAIFEKLLLMDKPIIWVMHDMWLFTGGCHIDRYCNRYAQNCGKCPRINSKRINDISRKNFERKIKMLKKDSVTLVAPSEWLMSCAQESLITNRNRIIRIANPIDKKVFYRREDIKKLKEKYLLPRDRRKIILFGAMKSNSDPNKGMQYLLKTLESLPSNEYTAVVFGTTKDFILPDISMEIISVGMIINENDLAELYSCADVFVAPSLQESFGYTVSEALACGTPVAAFKVGGVAEQIIHKNNGYLAQKGDAFELRKGIEWCTHINKKADDLRVICNSYEEVGKEWKDLCSEVLEKKRELQ